MTNHPLKKGWILLLAGILLAASTGKATSATISYTLRAGVDNIVTPDNAVIPVWGYAPVAGPFDATLNPGMVLNRVMVPGPVLTANVGDTLHVTVQNALPAGHNTSIVIPGQRMPTNAGGALLPPVYDNNSPPRVMSFTAESPSGGSADYYFNINALKAGTYRYESGTDPSVQIMMGLYGALVVRPVGAPQRAYDNTTPTQPGSAYDSEVVLLFSELDPLLNAAVHDNTYGTPAFPSTIHLNQKYFLINGVPYSQGRPPVMIGAAGTTTLLRFLNAGAQSFSPTLLGPTSLGTIMTVIAEDGNLLPYAETLSTLFLPPGKTHDVLVTPTASGKFPLFDRRLHVVNNVQRPGGMIAALVPAGSDVTGPAVSVLTAAPNPTLGASPILLSATATDIFVDAGSVVMAAEWYSDNTTPAGAGHPMSGTFGTLGVALSAYIDNSVLHADNNVIFVRAQDSYGNWGAPVNLVVNVNAPAPRSVSIVEASYGAGNVLTVVAKTNAVPGTATLSVTGTPAPMIYVGGSDSYWSRFVVDPPPPTVTVTVSGGGSATAPVPFP
jgi:FtsP/CotA-like multicopper oxidase with cupredoxin domain